MQFFQTQINRHLDTINALWDLEATVNQAAQMLEECLRRGNKILLCGNGGSAADSQHLAAEFVGRFIKDRRPLAALALSTDTSALTCIGNDYGFDDVFVRQVEALGKPGDVLIAISTSGNSPNVRKAVAAARTMGIQCVGLLGRDGGALRPEVDLPIVVPSSITAHIQEAHIFIGHCLCAMVERALGFAGDQ